ncbi:MAG: ribonuclease P protein component [Muribaculaceae bacterium]|nr:ribonuclease P protein component [Muribaculaceae bacterium]
MASLRLYKKEHLCGVTTVDSFFARKAPDVCQAFAYPVRALWRQRRDDGADCSRFLVMVPKKRLRHAVDRVAMRRRIREAYRLNRDLLPADAHLDIVYIYVADTLSPYAAVERALRRIFSKISETPRS